MNDDMRELVGEFLAESGEILESLGADLVALEQAREDPELVNRIFRGLHTIKGNSALFGFDELTSLAHEAESVMDEFRDGERTVTPAVIDLLLETSDVIRAMLADIEEGGEGEIDPGDLPDRLAAVVEEGEPEEVPEPAEAGTGDGPLAGREESTGSGLPPEEVEALRGDFVIEAREILEELDRDLVDLEEAPGDEELVHRIFRGMHTLKGNGALLGFEALGRLAHRAEDLLAEVRRGERPVDADLVDLLLRTRDALESMVNVIEAGGSGGGVGTSDLEADLEEALERGGGPDGEEEPGAGEAGEEEAASPAGETEPADDGDGGGPGGGRSGRGVESLATETIRVGLDRLDHLLDLAGELVLGRNRLARTTERLLDRFRGEDRLGDLREISAFLSQLSTQLQEAVMQARMVPLQRALAKAPRVVRDISRRLGKEIRIEVDGGDTELDKTVVESLDDPLLHLIRNAVDHGIEPPDEREEAGKPRQGTVRVIAYQEGNHILIRIEDDGRGIPADRIREKAVRKGILEESEAEDLSDREAWRLIFRPGFSTASQVSSISGRGVGMDVVRRNIEALKGRIDIESEPGEGTRFILKLPLTLAIIEALLVRVGEETYAIPLIGTEETIRYRPDEVQGIDEQPFVDVRGELCPVVDLRSVFDVPGERAEEDGWRYLVLVAGGGHPVGLRVDALVGQEEIVIKPLGPYLDHLPGFAGATVSGEGDVVLVVDLAGLLEVVREGWEVRSRGGAAYLT